MNNKRKCVLLSFRMIPANHKYFLLSDLASSRDYELCVLAVYDDGITALTGTKLVGCVSFSTDTEYGRCHSIRDQVSAITLISDTSVPRQQKYFTKSVSGFPLKMEMLFSYFEKRKCGSKCW